MQWKEYPENRLVEVMNCGFALPLVYMQERCSLQEQSGDRVAAGLRISRNAFERVAYWTRPLSLVKLALSWRVHRVIDVYSGGSDGPSHNCHVPHLSLSSPPPWLDSSGLHVERGSLG
ncbi:hypothetical protein TcBrA4_0002460 [Trypanosoma cruzi]|nr:hypothetical protein TcBrA4_0002460 [Trypanosoma cruzi]